MSELTTPPRPITPPPVPIFKGKTRRTPDRPCLNCGDATRGNFCPMCGQRKVEVRISLRRMLTEVLDDQFSLNSALPRTLGALFFRPGHLSREYVAGRIARYIPPFRLYIVSSLAFFVVLQLFSGIGDGARVDLADIVVSTDSAAQAAPAPGAAAAPADSAKEDWTESIKITTGVADIDRLARQKLDRFRGRTPQEAGMTLFGEFMEHAPTMMFVFLPVFAAVMKLIYMRRKRFYVEHFVFALHVHAFVFLAFALSVAVGNEVLADVLSVWMMIYIYWGMKRFYAQGWFRTLVKYCLLGSIYTLILGVAFVITAAVSFLLL